LAGKELNIEKRKTKQEQQLNETKKKGKKK